ncbi:MAG: ABC-type iron transport system FetAB ATPase subunit, partial [Planctomycetota bacterium]
MALEAHDLTKEIHGRVLYQDIGFLLEKGSSLVIRGASGSGKSQLLRHLSGLDSESDPHLVQSGIVIYEGRDFDDWGAFDWRAQISYVPQQVPRLDGTPAELVRSIADLRAQRSMLTNDPR